MATHNHTKTHIGSLTTSDNLLVTDHEQKAILLWNAFKERLGISEFVGVSYDLSSLLQRQDLESLIDEFSIIEIDNMLKDMPSNHAPGPDGFNGLFIKKCWSIIREDFFRVFHDFHSSVIDISCLNNSYITLIPKKPNPATVDDYRAISLLNYSLKCITKLLSIRLQLVMTKLVHPNQYGFIRGRTIQDCLAWAFQFLHICHHSKKEIVILKLDIEKAFDKIEHQFILEVLLHKGFLNKWIRWIEMLLKSGSSSVFLNGIPGKSFKCKRGVRQEILFPPSFLL